MKESMYARQATLPMRLRSASLHVIVIPRERFPLKLRPESTGQDSMLPSLRLPRLHLRGTVCERTRIETIKVDAGATGEGNDSTSSTRSGPTSARPRTVAASVVTGPENPSQSRGERYAPGHFESGSPVGADDTRIIAAVENGRI
jgi:hypothetical protein